MEEIRSQLDEIVSKLDTLKVHLDVAGARREIASLEEASAAPDFWDDPRAAGRMMHQLTLLRARADEWERLHSEAVGLRDLLELAEIEEASDVIEDVQRDTIPLARLVDQLEFQTLLSGEYAENGAILSVHAGAGGTESQDWAEMLLRMYIRWAEQHKFQVDILERSEGEEAGIKSATIDIRGPYVYGHLRGERGVHRLVRLSPYDAAHRRHTSFALVEVLPEIEDEVEAVKINPDELRVDTYRSSGAGGQHVNKTDSAVRITHLPTGIVVTCQNERSQLQNREVAMRILSARLLERQLEEREAEQLRLKGEHVAAGWGNQIRSYVLHPYNMVKDLRTQYETSNTAAVLNGEIDPFIESYLRSNPYSDRSVGQGEPAAAG
ncbi:MAG TPA: peptide chain release factor 2 [Chloroflexota bacterium]